MTAYLVSTTATDTRCPRCRAAVITAIDEGIPARVDATPLPDRTAEIAALLDGKHTYVLTDRRHLFHRDASRIAGGSIHGTIHAEHTCAGPTQLTIEDLIGSTNA